MTRGEVPTESGTPGQAGSRAAIVTGASGGIGAAICVRLLADGISVLGVDQRPDPAGRWPTLQLDLTTREGNRQAIEEAKRRFGRLDVVVANAGIQHVAAVADFPEDRWDTLLSLMLTSPFLLAKYAWSALIESPEARFIAIASAHGLVASPGKAAYVAAKHGVLGLIKALALEGAQHGILATAVCPGFVRTALVEDQIAQQAATHELPEDTVLDEIILAPHAVKRLIEPEEVADVVAFLTGPGGRSFTGAPVTMDLAWTAR